MGVQVGGEGWWGPSSGHTNGGTGTGCAEDKVGFSWGLGGGAVDRLGRAAMVTLWVTLNEARERPRREHWRKRRQARRWDQGRSLQGRSLHLRA